MCLGTVTTFLPLGESALFLLCLFGGDGAILVLHAFVFLLQPTRTLRKVGILAMLLGTALPYRVLRDPLPRPWSQSVLQRAPQAGSPASGLDEAVPWQPCELQGEQHERNTGCLALISPEACAIATCGKDDKGRGIRVLCAQRRSGEAS